VLDPSRADVAHLVICVDEADCLSPVAIAFADTNTSLIVDVLRRDLAI
jgi:hypothetical protein